jgi:hypothetical protein
VLAVYNRPEKLRRLLEIVADAQPTKVLVIADGPREGDSDDVQRVAAARRMLDRIDWPCEVLRRESPVNVGCDTWVPAGIDWAFDHVSEAIFLEDDVVVHPEFFAWCASMLRRYAVDERIHCVCGRNEMARWGDGTQDHFIVRRGSHLGCGTWRRAWKAARTVDLPAVGHQERAMPQAPAEGSLVSMHLRMLSDLSRAHSLRGWDARWELQRAMLGGLCAVSATNQVAHGGYDDEATHGGRSVGLRAVQPVLAPERDAVAASHQIDDQLDRWSLLIELADLCHDARMACRLAKSSGLALDPHARHHLAPFVPGSDLIHALEHLRAVGCGSPVIDRMLDVLGESGRNRATQP